MRSKNYEDIVIKNLAELLAPNQSIEIDHVHSLKPHFNLPYVWICNQSKVQLQTIKAFFEANLANGIIQ